MNTCALPSLLPPNLHDGPRQRPPQPMAHCLAVVALAALAIPGAAAARLLPERSSDVSLPPELLRHVLSLLPVRPLAAWSSGGSTVVLAESGSQAAPLTLSGHTDDVNDVKFLPGAQRLVTVDFSGVIIVWDVWSGEQLHVLRRALWGQPPPMQDRLELSPRSPVGRRQIVRRSASSRPKSGPRQTPEVGPRSTPDGPELDLGRVYSMSTDIAVTRSDLGPLWSISIDIFEGPRAERVKPAASEGAAAAVRRELRAGGVGFGFWGTRLGALACEVPTFRGPLRSSLKLGVSDTACRDTAPHVVESPRLRPTPAQTFGRTQPGGRSRPG